MPFGGVLDIPSSSKKDIGVQFFQIAEETLIYRGSLKTIKAAKKALEAREEALNPGQFIAGKRQISFADTEARIRGKKGDFDYRYNRQISVDSGQHLSQDTNDKQDVKVGLENIEKSTGQLPEKMSLDNGYQSATILKRWNRLRLGLMPAVDRGEKSHSEPLVDAARALCKAGFIYDEQADCFHCPGGQRLVLKRQGQDGT